MDTSSLSFDLTTDKDAIPSFQSKRFIEQLSLCISRADALPSVTVSEYLSKFHNRVIISFIAMLMISYPTSPSPSLEALCSLKIGKLRSASVECKKSRIDISKEDPSMLEIKLFNNTTPHHLPLELQRVMCFIILVRQVIIKILTHDKRTKKIGSQSLHMLHSTLLCNVTIKGTHHSLQKISKELLRKELTKELNNRIDVNSTFDIIGFNGNKQGFFERDKIMSGTSNSTLSIVSEHFLHAQSTHEKEYSDSNVHQHSQKQRDQKRYKAFGLTLPSPSVNEHKYSETVQFCSFAKNEYELLLQAFVNTKYVASDAFVNHANEICTGAATSLHICRCGSGKTTYVLLPSIKRWMMKILTNANNDFLQEFINIRMQSIDNEKQVTVQKNLENLKCSLGTSVNGGDPHGCTILIVPTVALAKSHQISINQSNLINAREFEDEAFRAEMNQFPQIYYASIDIWIMTYAKCVVLRGLLQQSSELGYVKEFFFDESQCFVQEYLTFHDNLRSLHLQLLKVPIHLLTGSLTIEEQRILIKMIGMNRPSTAMHRGMVSDKNSDRAFQIFKSRAGIHRDNDTSMPEGLVHYQVQRTEYDHLYCSHESTVAKHKDGVVMTNVLMALDKLFKNNDNEIGDVIIFVPTKDDVDTMNKIAQDILDPHQTATLTGKWNDESEISHRERVDAFVNGWVNGTEKVAICTTSGSVGKSSSNQETHV